ncbi:MAG: hypothetical protein IJX62_08040 [Clostridia bacterium]|nr:hypothetical protein [Clostridia bacterium]
MEHESSVKDIITNSLEQIKTVIDANTVVGNQITTPSGTVIIPISRLSMGFASGGLDLPAKNEAGSKNFGGGGGTGVSVVPIGFLTVYPDGRVEMLPMNPEKSTPIEQVADILDHTPDIIARIKDVFAGVSAAREEATEEAPDAMEQAKKLEEKYSEKLAEEIIEPLSKKEIRKIKKAEAKEAKEAKKLAKRIEKL